MDQYAIIEEAALEKTNINTDQQADALAEAPAPAEAEALAEASAEAEAPAAVEVDKKNTDESSSPKTLFDKIGHTILFIDKRMVNALFILIAI